MAQAPGNYSENWGSAAGAVFLSPPKLKKSSRKSGSTSTSSSSGGGSAEKKQSHISRLVAAAVSGGTSVASPYASNGGGFDPVSGTNRAACLFIPDDFEEDEQEDEYGYLYNGPDGGFRPRQRAFNSKVEVGTRIAYEEDAASLFLISAGPPDLRVFSPPSLMKERFLFLSCSPPSCLPPSSQFFFPAPPFGIAVCAYRAEKQRQKPPRQV